MIVASGAVWSFGEHMFVYDQRAVNAVILLYQMGLSKKRIGRVTHTSTHTVRRWLQGRMPGTRGGRRPQRMPTRNELLSLGNLASYAYLLGLYLGDGHIVAQHRGVYELRITMDSRYPGIIGETVRAMHAVLPRNRASVRTHARHNVVTIMCSSKAMPILFRSMALAKSTIGA